jgi:membrane protein required for colicin V production
MTITFYDALMLLIVFVAVIQGAWRGMVWQIAPIASLVLGYIVAYPMSANVAHYFGEPPTNRLFAMIAIYLAVSLAVYLMVRSVRESLERLKLVEFDKHLGALLGGVKGVLFTVVLTIGLLSVSTQARTIILPSETRTISARLMAAISPILPQAFNDLIRPYVEKLHEGPAGVPEPDMIGGEFPPLDPFHSTARSEKIIKPNRFDDSDDGFAPPARDPGTALDADDLFSQPRQPSSRGSERPADQDDFFNADPDKAFNDALRRPR